MAESRFGLESIANKVRGKGNEGDTAPNSPPENRTQLKRADFVLTETRTEIDPRTGEVKDKAEYADVSEVVGTTSEFLENYANRLLGLRSFRNPANPDQTLFEGLMQDPDHELERRILKLLTDEQIDQNTGEITDIQVSQQKIKDLLSPDNPKGWKVAIQLMEHQLALKQQGLGAVSDVEPGSNRSSSLEDLDLKVGEGYSLWDKLKNKKIGPGSAEKYKLAQNTNKAWLESFDRTDLMEVAYFKAMTGVDVNDFEVSGDKVVRRAPPYVPKSINTQEIQADIVRLTDTRRKFMGALGIPPRILDSLPEQGLFKNKEFEQSGVNWEAAVIDRLNYTGGVVMNAGEIDVTPTLRNYMKARREVLLDDVNEYLRKERQTPSQDKPVQILREKKEAREKDDGRVRQQKEAALTEQQKHLNEDKDMLTAEQSKLTPYQTEVAELNRLRAELQSNFSISTNSEIHRKIQDIDIQLHDHTIVGSVAEMEYKLLSDYHTDLRAEHAGVTAKSAKAREADEEAATKLVNKRYEARFNQVNAKREELEQQKSLLKSYQEKLKVQESKLAESQETVITGSKVIQELSQSHTEITGLHRRGVSELDDTALITKTIEELLNEVNNAHTAGLGGWPQDENENPENRRMLQLAITEAKSKVKDHLDPEHPRRYTILNTLNSWGLTENQLATLSAEEIDKLANHRYRVTSGAEGWDSSANTDPRTMRFKELAGTEARRRVDIRLSTLKEQIDSVQKTVESLEKQKKSIDLTKEINQIEKTIQLVENQPEVLKNAEDLITEFRKFTDRTPIDPTDPQLSEAEKATPYPKGYYEIIDFLFNYRNNPEQPDRNENFKKIQDVLSPDELADILNQSFQLRIASGHVNMNSVLAALSTDIYTRDINEYNVREKVIRMINTTRDRALALD